MARRQCRECTQQRSSEPQPFPGNPSFRPPPPLSNALQDRIYEQLVKGEKDIATLAPEYNISKARISAIHKLKQVEAEFRRQVSSMPLGPPSLL